ncbi:phosphodiesterase [Lentilitoribacter sp. Alg239-R112]|uniref:phosphodiesterase n=1 Tax=Lentilitoribacter sp. Alg239-R112 TaxID=2305987 RepID=UPI0013A6DD13|nr:phosphodiesterase [Lentilitoribacter sp. Alg239-R112]
MTKFTKIIQLSDTHIVREGTLAYGVVDTAKYLEQAVRAINERLENMGPIDGLVISGDLTDFGTPEEYERFQRLIEPLTFPTVVMPGNHDDREAMRGAFQFENQSGPLNTHRIIGPVHVLALDSLVTSKPHGFLTNETLAWLKQKLAGINNEPIMVALHHPPFDTGIEHMDCQRLRNSEELLDILNNHKGAKQIVCGHVHRHITSFDNRCPAIIAPSPAHAVALDHRKNGPSDFTMEPGGVLLHTCSNDDICGGMGYRFRSEFVPLGTFDGPYSFGL